MLAGRATGTRPGGSEMLLSQMAWWGGMGVANGCPVGCVLSSSICPPEACQQQSEWPWGLCEWVLWRRGEL